MNPSEGRVPVSWNECADWLEAFGFESVLYNSAHLGWRPSVNDLAWYRQENHGVSQLSSYRLLPPPGLVAAPEGMDGGGWLGQGKDVPDGWPWRGYSDAEWIHRTPTNLERAWLVQCRPPAPKREPEWVPLYEALAAERVADSPGVGPFVVARVVRAPDGPVLAMSADGSRYVHVREDGMVLVLAEGER